MYFNPANFNSQNNQYFDASIDAADLQYPHCVTIVGWNDSFTFSGASNPGGWIVKDSYGTSWADNGYFYCSYEDAGILSESAVFPVRHELPQAGIISHAYYHDKFGWVDNYGFNSNIGYALAKYTITPTSGVVAPQFIQRIGSYAVVENTTIEIAVFLTKTGNVLSDQIASASVFCPVPGFYTVEFDLEALNFLTDVYIRAKYITPQTTQNPIPIETLESGHTSNFLTSLNSCWVSADGNTWISTGTGTSNLLDVCIKMFTVNADITSAGQPLNQFHTLFPNPASERLTVEIPAAFGPISTVVITDISGRTIFQREQLQSNRLEFDVSEFPAGAYYLSAESSSGRFTSKWLKD
jgi:hypothetical protein